MENLSLHVLQRSLHDIYSRDVHTASWQQLTESFSQFKIGRGKSNLKQTRCNEPIKHGSISIMEASTSFSIQATIVAYCEVCLGKLREHTNVL